MKIMYPDYDNSILSLANSILKYFGVEHTHKTLTKLDSILDNGYKNVVLMVFDAMGSKNIETVLPKESFLREHMIDEISSVYPPTTVAATTTIESGLAPVEHSWLGWTLHFKEVNDNVTVFRNTNDNGDIVADYNVATTYIPYKSIISKINDTEKAKAYSISPFGTCKVNSIEELVNSVEKICNEEGRKYLYTYWPEPDHSMHGKGIFSEDAKEWMRIIDKKVSELSTKLKDTLIIVTADHGHIDGENVLIKNHKKIVECLKHLPTIEPRAVNFHVKDDMKEKFEIEFKKEFGDSFILLSKEEVIDKKLFGIGKEHPRFNEFLGDYLGLAKKKVSIFNNKDEYDEMIGVHAGITEWEMKVPFIVVECNK